MSVHLLAGIVTVTPGLPDWPRSSTHLVLWGADGIMTKLFNPLDVWRDYAEDVTGWAIECGHFLAEEEPEHTCQALHDFFTA